MPDEKLPKTLISLRRLPHGEWGAWLKQNVDYSQSTANNLMKIFEEFGQNQLLLYGGTDEKSQALENLSYTNAIALLGIPEDERGQFIAENDIENMSSRELQQAIKDKQALEKQLKESKANEEKERLAYEKLSKNFEEFQSQSKQHDDKVQKLETELESAKAKGGNDQDIQKLQESLKESKEEIHNSRIKIKQLDAELKKKPIDITVEKIVEIVPESVELELQELRKKEKQLLEMVVKQNKTPVIKFEYCIELLSKDFNDLLSALEEIKGADPEEYEKYKKVVLGVIARMTEFL